MRTNDKRRLAYIEAIKVTHSEAIFSEGKTTFSRKELRQVSDAHGWKWIPNWITHDVSRRADRGVFTIPEVMDAMAVQPGQGHEGDDLADSTHTDATPTVEEVQCEMASI